ncbi:MAG: BatA and WFA domain-containing protein [Phycisphaeraceae bacterium]|nr:BatA and WFA domain-containing protein [Phycisphaeraceae bacterium]
MPDEPPLLLAALALTTPLMLMGALLVSLPIIAHLLNRKAKRKLVFPNIELLRSSAASQSALFRLRRWILLLLRALAVLLIVAAFARPLWSNDPAIAESGNQGSAVVLLVDRSLSVQGSSGSVSGLRAMQASSDQVLAEMTSGVEVANVVYADAVPSAALPSMTSNLNVLRQELERLEATEQRADFNSAIAKAGKILSEQSSGKAGQVVVLSDLQKSNWADVDFKAANTALPKGTKVTVLPAPAPAADNAMIGKPGYEPAIPMVGQPTMLRAQVKSFSGTPRDIVVTLRVNGRKLETRTVKLAPEQSRDVVFTHGFDRVGDHRVAMTIEDDELNIDNTAHLAVRVLERVPVVIIGDSDPNRSGTDTYFLSRAVAPRGGTIDSYEVRYVSTQEPVGAQFDQAAVVIIADSKPLNASLLKALQAYLVNGGSVIMYCDNGPVQDKLASIAVGEEGLQVPWRPVQLRDLGAQGNWVRLGEADWRSRLLRTFDLPSQESLKQIAFREVWRVDDVQDTMRVVMAFEDGSPAIGQSMVGSGNLVVCNFSPALGASDLGKYGSFVALTHAMVQALTPQSASGIDISPGMPLTIGGITGFKPDGDAPRVVGPDDKPIPDAMFSTLGDTLVASVRVAERAGFYRVMQGDYTLALAAVNVDPLESDPGRITEQALAELFSSAGANAVQADGNATGGLLDLRGTPLWGWMAALAMLMLAAEMFVVGYFRR